MGEERVPLAGIQAADEHLGCPVPLPSAPLPLARWVEVVAVGSGAVQVEWNLDDTRPRAPGRLTLCVSHDTPPERGLPEPTSLGRYAYRTAPLTQAESALRPVQELAWQRAGLHLRLTGQGPWELGELVALADSVA
ncbi:MAG TPA: hypothetical protein VF526_04210 [Solirubrobacteraceae bacterium]|jgi:hypothetical protein